MLDVRDLTVGYGKRKVLHGLSAVFEAGALTCIIGPNGCGKSTLLKAILGLIPRMMGDVRLDGKSLDGFRRGEIAKCIAYLAQGQEITDMTVGQMVLHGRFPYLDYPRSYTARDRALARAAMERVGISHLAEEPMAALSGGLRQTAYIAMALAQQTPYILLDEPTTYLDAAHQIALMRLMKDIAAEGRGVVAVMHDLPLALSYADHLAVMADGKMMAEGTPLEILQSGVIREIFGVDVIEAEGEFFCCLRGHR